MKDWDIFGKGRGPKTVGYWVYRDGKIESRLKPDAKGWYKITLKQPRVFSILDLIAAALLGATVAIVSINIIAYFWG